MEIKKSAIVPHSAAKMYRLVDDIVHYPQFLPWCQKAVEHDRTASHVTASLDVARLGITKSFTTRNTLIFPTSIQIELIEGPFSHLQGLWTFEPLGDGCQVKLHLHYDTEGRWFDMAFSTVFDYIANSLVEAFCERALEIYKE